MDPRHTFCKIFYDLFVIFSAKFYVFLTHSYVIMATKYHLLGLGPKACAYNFALGSAWTPNPSILKDNAGMGLIAYLVKFVGW